MAIETAQLESYLESFTDFAKAAAGETPQWLRELRENAFARFYDVGIPTTRDEDWRFTNLSALRTTPFRLVRESAHPFTFSDLAAWRMEGAAARMVFVNGRFAPELSIWGPIADGVTVSSLRNEIVNRPDVVAEHLGRYLNIERDPFCALNTAFAEDGTYVHVRRGIAVEQPIHLLFITTSSATPAMTHPRNLIVVEEEGQASIIEDYVSFGPETPAFSNIATELVARGNATVNHIMLEREHQQSYNFSTLRIEQARNANVASHSLLLGGALVRNNVHPVLAGEGGECLINGLFIGSGRQHLDNYMLVEHASPHCASRQFYNGVLDERAHGVFHGRIIVHKDAQKTDAKQTNRNLLLTDDALIDTKPQLEIYADDVKCTHGATIGQIDDNALFYLRSRGIHEAEARRLLLEAFAGECLDRIVPDAAREYAAAVTEERLLQVAKATRLKSSGTAEEQERSWEEVG
ncbi:MAG TPA: Fe-S cluster assembly protein SufD [Terracidiphilus sp.]|nr:Fe-S cluster assembly protein SufD [Terracidiphilus sp.]